MYRAEQSHWWYQGMAALTRSVLEIFYAPGSGLTILDAGCGTGGGLLFLSRYGSVTGLDISAHALCFCAERECTKVTRASVMALPFREKSFDLVTSFDILYFEGIDDQTALRETARVLRPGGRLLIRVPALTGCEERMTPGSPRPIVTPPRSWQTNWWKEASRSSS